MKIQKKSGEIQEFDPRKLEESIRLAGASQDVARRVAERIQPSEGMWTGDLRRAVADELRKENMALSGACMSARKLRARLAQDLSAGVARLHADHLRGISSDRSAMLVSGGTRAELRIEPTASAASHEVLLSRADLQRLGIQEGSRVVIRYPLQDRGTSAESQHSKCRHSCLFPLRTSTKSERRFSANLAELPDEGEDP